MHAGPGMIKIINGLLPMSQMRTGCRLARNTILPAALRLFCNISEAYMAQGRHPSKICVTLEDVATRIAD